MNVLAQHKSETVFELSVRNHQLISDNTPEYGGEDAGFMPSELLLCAVASCFGQAILHVAKRMHNEIGELSLDVSGIKDRKHFCFHSINIRLYSSTPAEQLRKVANLAKKYCFVVNSLAIPVNFEIENSPMKGI